MKKVKVISVLYSLVLPCKYKKA